MTTLPPEGADGQETGVQPTNNVPPPPPTPPTPPVGQPAAPQQPQYQAPPQYQVPPQQPPQDQVPPQQPPQYQVPPQQPPQYQVPPQQPQQPGGYPQPPQQPGGYPQPPQGGYYAQPPVSDPVSNITLNYWLTIGVSFIYASGWIPALIFFLIEKDKGNQQVRAYHAANLNFSLLRIGVVVASFLLLLVPVLGGILFVITFWIPSIVLFIFQIMAAVKAPEAFRRGEKPPFIFNIQMVK